MNKNLKVVSAVLSAGLLIAPVTSILQNNQNVAKAADLKRNKAIKKVVTVKNSDVLNILKGKYQNGELSEKDYNIIKSEFDNRWGAAGQTKIVFFWDGAFDLYLNSYYSYAIADASIGGATVLLTSLLAAAGVTDGASLFAVSSVGAFIGMVAGTELSNGVIVYFKRAPLGQYYPSQIRQQ